MSTVSKQIADDIIAGKYPEDNVFMIVKYTNIYDDKAAYKIYYSLNGKYPAAINMIDEINRIYSLKCGIYWIKDGVFTDKEVISLKAFYPCF